MISWSKACRSKRSRLKAMTLHMFGALMGTPKREGQEYRHIIWLQGPTYCSGLNNHPSYGPKFLPELGVSPTSNVPHNDVGNCWGILQLKPLIHVNIYIYIIYIYIYVCVCIAYTIFGPVHWGIFLRSSRASLAQQQASGIVKASCLFHKGPLELPPTL